MEITFVPESGREQELHSLGQEAGHWRLGRGAGWEGWEAAGKAEPPGEKEVASVPPESSGETNSGCKVAETAAWQCQEEIFLGFDYKCRGLLYLQRPNTFQDGKIG